MKAQGLMSEAGREGSAAVCRVNAHQVVEKKRKEGNWEALRLCSQVEKLPQGSLYFVKDSQVTFP